MLLIKIACGFLAGAAGIAAMIFLWGYYFLDDSQIFIPMIGLMFGPFIGGIVGARYGVIIHWSKAAFLRLGAFTLVGTILTTILWLVVPGRSVDPEVLAKSFTPEQWYQQAPFGLIFGASIGVAAGLVSLRVWGDDHFPSRKSIVTEMAEAEDGACPPSPPQRPS